MAEPIFQFDSEKEATKALKEEGRKLKYIAISIWRQYLSSYKPNTYVRTRTSQQSIKLGAVKELSPNTLGIELTWDDDLVYHNSLFGGKQGHSVMLISEGWKSSKGKSKDVYRFGYFEGIDYIGRVKQAFELGARKGIVLEVQWAGNEFKKQKTQKNVLR